MRKNEDNIPIRLFLDDIRIPEDVTEYMPSNLSKEYKLFNWIVVRDYNGFVSTIELLGTPSYISFDHDLASEHYVPEEYWGDYNKSKAYQDSKLYTEKTGYDCAKWLCEYLDGKPLPICFIHSLNPVGRDNIKNLLENYKKNNDTKNI